MGMGNANLLTPASVDKASLLSADPIFGLEGAERQAAVLIVDALDINRRLLRAMLKAAPYRVLEAQRAADAFEILRNENIDLIILDLMMPEMSGPEFCRRIKADRTTQLVPILMITALQGIENEITGIASGADEFLTRPLHPDVVRTRVRAMLRNKSAIDSLEEAETILFALAQAVEKRDKYTGDHCDRLAHYSLMLGSALGLPKWQLQALHRGGYLHDIGKVCVPDAILFKKGPLTEEEWVVMRAHTTKGEEICRPMKTLAPVLPIIRSHHERWDGTGYPDGLKGEEIPLVARILQIADIFDALTTARPYKAALSLEESMSILDEESRRGWRDAELVSLFQDCCKKMDIEGGTNLSSSLDAMRRELLK
jgi:putative two-component system response regulator